MTTMLDHLNRASEELQEALLLAAPMDAEAIQAILDQVNAIIATGEAIDLRDRQERASRDRHD